MPDLAALRALVRSPANDVSAPDCDPAQACAEDVCAGRFTLLGFPIFELGPIPDWHTDPSSGHRWDPVIPAHALDLMTRDSPADARVVWELNRFHHAVVLGMAWRHTHEGRYPATFAAHVTNWLDTNPPGYGINWTCAMEVAIRAVNWLFACAMMQEVLPSEFVRLLMGALLTHGRYVRANLELALVTTNHYLADLCGLAVLGIALGSSAHGFRSAAPGAEPDRWRRFALRELAREMAFQVYPDGGSFEASTGYHWLVTELFDLPVWLAQQMEIPVPPTLAERVPRMHAFTTAVLRPDGTLPLVGDSDDGRLLLPVSSQEPEDRNRVFSEKLGFSDAPPDIPSTAFPHAGIYVMRNENLYLICDCGTNGQRGNGGHAHNDTLSFELYAGRPWIVDPGTYAYTGDLDAYNWFRSTAAHNTLVVDGEEQARFDLREPFLLAPDAVPTVHRWETGPAYDFLDAEHAGYRRLPGSVVHRRCILFDKQRGLWLVCDVVTGRGLHRSERHRLDWYFHFDPGFRSAPGFRSTMSVVNDESRAGLVRATAPGGRSELSVDHSPLSSSHRASLLLMPLTDSDLLHPFPHPLKLTIEAGWVSYCYGHRERAPVAHYTAGEVALPVAVTFALVPAFGPLSVADPAQAAEQSLVILEKLI